MEKITIDNIIAFTKEAMKNNINVNSSYFNNISCDEPDNVPSFSYCIGIINDEESISFNINSNSICLYTKRGSTGIENILTEREKVNLESLRLDIKEYNKERALSRFETFFNEMNKLSDIDDLDNEDD